MKISEVLPVAAKVLTIGLGGLPAIVLVCLGMYFSFYSPGGTLSRLYGLLVLSPLAIWGTVALWRSAIGPMPVERKTAIGLLAGLGAMIGFRFYPIYIMFLMALPQFVLKFMDSWLVYSPPVVALTHLLAAIFCKSKGHLGSQS